MKVFSIEEKYNNLVKDLETLNKSKQSYLEIIQNNKYNGIINSLEKRLLPLVIIFIGASFWSLYFLVPLVIMVNISLYLSVRHKYLQLGFVKWYKEALCKKYRITDIQLKELEEIKLLSLRAETYEDIKNHPLVIYRKRIDEILG